MLFVDLDYLNKKDAKVLKAQIEQQAKERKMLEAEYENRLKADMVAMLEELQKEIIELPFPQREPEYMQGYSYCQMNILDYVIQQKINSLKAESEELRHCESCRNYHSHHGVCDICKDFSCWTQKEEEGVQIEDEIVKDYCNKCTKRNDARKDMICRHCYMQPSMYEYDEDSEE